MDEILEKWGWVVFTFNDGSKRHLYTTLSEKLLSESNAKLKEGFLYDLVSHSYVKIRKDAVSVDFYEKKPVYSDEEVLSFASKFI